MSNRVLVGIIVCLVVIGTGGLYFTLSRDKDGSSGSAQASGDCGTETEFEWNDQVMALGDAKPGDKLTLIEGYYGCNPVKVGDVVLYRFSQSKDPVVRRVRAVPGDKFEVVFEESAKRWNLVVNGDLLKGAGDEPYRFGAEPAPPLKLYEKDRAETGLKDDEVILTVDNGPGFLDSGMFGVISKTDLVGRIVEP